MSRTPAAITLALVASAAAWAVPAPASAKSEKTVGWDLSTVFATAVRFLRIDEKVVVVEKDADAGYVLFDLKEEKKTFRGALELVPFEKDGRQIVRVILRIEDRPEYVEVGMLERLEIKLRGERGMPPRPKPPEPRDGKDKEKDKDAGKDGPSTGPGSDRDRPADKPADRAR